VVLWFFWHCSYHVKLPAAESFIDCKNWWSLVVKLKEIFNIRCCLWKAILFLYNLQSLALCVLKCMIYSFFLFTSFLLQYNTIRNSQSLTWLYFSCVWFTVVIIWSFTDELCWMCSQYSRRCFHNMQLLLDVLYMLALSAVGIGLVFTSIFC